MSFSTYQYSNIKGQRTATGATASVRVKNSAGPEGDEMVQLYVAGHPDGAIRSRR